MKPITETDLEQLSAYLDGELSDSERRFFQKRLTADAALREACERAWLASSVLKAQPIQLMPSGSAAQICAQCPGAENAARQPWRVVASVAALAVVLGLGYQLSRDQTPGNAAPLQTQSMPQALPSQAAEPSTQPAILEKTPGQSIASTGTAVKKTVQDPVAVDDPTQFVLNDATRSKAWPKRDQAMDDYLARHNQMSDANAGSDLITYAQWLAEPEQTATPSADAQDKK